MAVILRDMYMPLCCNDCRFSVWRPRLGNWRQRLDADGYIVQCQAMPEGDDDEIDWRGEGGMKRLENCPLEGTT